MGEGSQRAQRVSLKSDQFAVIALPSGEERLEPLLDVSPGGVAVLLRAARPELVPGTTLPRLRLFTSGECSLDGSANVREITQISLADGGVAYKLGLRFEQKKTQANDAETFHTEPQVIADALHNLLTARAKGLVEAAQLTLPMSLAQIAADRSHFALTPQESTVKLTAGQECKLTFDLYGTRIILHVAYQGRRGNDALFAWPKRIATVRQRLSSRLRSLPASITVAFESPFTQVKRQRKVVDLSAGGLAFATEPQDNLVVGVLLTGLTLQLPSGAVHGRGIVRHVRYDTSGKLIAGVELLNLLPDSVRVLTEFVQATVHPQVRWAQPNDLSRLWNVYADVGLFQRELAALSPVIGRIDATRKTLMSRGKEVFLQVVGTSDGDLRGTAELLRTHEHTWTLQHVGASPSSRLTVDQLTVPLLEEGLRQKARFVRTLVWPSPTGLQRLRDLRPDGKTLMWRELVVISEGPSFTAPQSLPCDVQSASQADLDWAAQKLLVKLSLLESQALDLSPAQLLLPAIERLYRTVGVSRRRLVRLASSVGGPLGLSLVEQSGAGLNFLGMCDTVRIVPLARSLPVRQTAVVSLLFDAIRLQREAGKRGVAVLVDPEDVPITEKAGCTSHGTIIEVVSSAQAARQLVNFLQLVA